MLFFILVQSCSCLISSEEARTWVVRVGPMGNVNTIGHSRATSLRGGRLEALKANEGAAGWDEACVQRLLVEGKIAPRGVGSVEPGKGCGIECPICFFYYGVVNCSTCCHQPICTDCYLRVRPPRRGAAACPFCGKDGFAALASRDETKEVATAQAQEVTRSYPKALAPSPASSSHSGLKVLPQCGAAARIPKAVAREDVGAAGLATPVASVEDRTKLEEQMRAQLDEARRRGDSAPAPPPAPSRQPPRSLGGLGVMLARSRHRGEANLTLEDLHTLLHSLPTDLQQVEELMVLEAMQASLEDEDRRQREAAAPAPAANSDDLHEVNDLQDPR